MNHYGLIDVVNSGLGAANSITGVYTQLAQQQAEQQLFSMKENLSADMNNFLLNLEKNSNYENWDQQVDTFLQQRKDKLSLKPKAGFPNPYYAKSSYVAQEATRMLDTAYTDLKQKVAIMTLGKMKEEALIKAQETKKVIENNPGMSREEKIVHQGYIEDQNFVSGNIDYSTYVASRQNDAARGVLSDMSNYADALIEAGKDWNEIKKEIDNKYSDNFDVAVLSGSTSKADFDEGNASWIKTNVNIENEKRKILKEKESIYKATIQEKQQQNANRLSEIVSQMRTQNDPVDRMKTALHGQKILQNMKGKDLTESDRLQYSAIFDIQKEIAAESKNYDKAREENKKESDKELKEWIEKAPDSFMQKFLDGTLGGIYEQGYKSLEEANEYLHAAFKDKLNELFDNEEDKTNATVLYTGILDSFMRTVISRLMNDNKNEYGYASVVNKINQIRTEIGKDKTDCPPEAFDMFISFGTDLIASNDASLMKPDEIVKELDRAFNYFHAKKMDFLVFNKNGKLKNKINTEKDLGKALAELSQPQNDIIFTDIHGKDRWFDDKDREALEADNGVVKGAKKILADALGIENPADIESDYQLTPNNDKTPVPVLKYQGQTFTVKSVNESGEVTSNPNNVKGVAIFDADGNEIKNMLKTKKETKEAVKDKTQRRVNLYNSEREKYTRAASAEYNWNKLPKYFQKEIGNARKWQALSSQEKYQKLKENNLID